MKNQVTKIAYFLFLGLIFSSCKKDKLSSSNPKLLSSFTYNVGEDSTRNFSEEKFIYNSAEQLIRYEFETKENGIAKYKRYTDYEYNGDSLLTKMISVGTLGDIYSNSNTYSYTNKILTSYSSSSSSRNDVYNYLYNTDGSWSQKTWSYNNTPNTYIYTYLNNKINKYEVQKPSNEVEYHTIEELNNNGLVTKKTYYNYYPGITNSSNVVYIRDKYSYDDDGNVTQSVRLRNNILEETTTTVFDNKKSIYSLMAPLPELLEPFYGRSTYHATHNQLSYTITSNNNGTEYIRYKKTNVYEYNSQGYPIKEIENSISYNPNGSISSGNKPRVTIYKIQ